MSHLTHRKPISIPATPAPEDRDARDAQPGKMFQGYDSVSGAGRQTALEGEETDIGANSTVEYRVCMGISELKEALEIEQSLSVGFGPFFSATQKMKFVKELKVTTNSISIVVMARHIKSTRLVTDFKLKSGVKPPRTDDEIKHFVRNHGDSFLSTIVWGGEFFAVYSFCCQSSEEQKKLHGELELASLINIVNVGAGFQARLEEFVSKTSTQVHMKSEISGLLNPPKIEPDKLLEYAYTFTETDLTAPTIISFSTTGYESLDDFDKFTPIVTNREYFTGTPGIDGGLTDDLVSVQQLLDQCELIQGVYNCYGGFRDDTLEKASEYAKGDRAAIFKQMKVYEDNPVQPFQKPALPSLEHGLPVLAFNTREIPVCFGGGESFQDIDLATVMMEKTQITRVQLRSDGNKILQLTTGYRSIHGDRSASRGPGGGTPTTVLTLGPRDWINQIDISYDENSNIIVVLGFTLTDGRYIGAGATTSTSKTVTITPSDLPNSFILGFTGRVNQAGIGNLTVCLGALKPADWSKDKH